ncbi:MAG: NUDIX hydrolase [Bacteroidetes bacterium]|nr:NUDIX hydrolase [Bacteroidota bacterium]
MAVKGRYCYDYPRPAVTVDAVVFYISDTGNIEVLLIRRSNPPFEGAWAFPGGFVDENETVEQAVQRETAEETGVVHDGFELFGVYSKPDRDPRHRTITVVFMSLLGFKPQPLAGDDAARAAWFGIDALPEMAFDHRDILEDVLASFHEE